MVMAAEGEFGETGKRGSCIPAVSVELQRRSDSISGIASTCGVAGEEGRPVRSPSSPLPAVTSLSPSTHVDKGSDDVRDRATNGKKPCSKSLSFLPPTPPSHFTFFPRLLAPHTTLLQKAANKFQSDGAHSAAVREQRAHGRAGEKCEERE